jgi:hypothetical protein
MICRLNNFRGWRQVGQSGRWAHGNLATAVQSLPDIDVRTWVISYSLNRFRFSAVNPKNIQALYLMIA